MIWIMPTIYTYGLTYTTTFTPPVQCSLPVIDANTHAQWGMVEGTGTTIDNMEGTAAADGTASNCFWGEPCTCDVPGVPVEIPCYYDSGLEGQFSITCYDTFILRLICYEPFWSQVGESSAVTTMSDSLQLSMYVVAKINGEFMNLGPPAAPASGGTIYAIAENDQYVYIGGDFTDWDGVANADYIAQYEKATGTWSALSATLLDGMVRGLAIGPDGTLYIVGDFTLDPGVANADYICTWDGTSFAALGDPNSGGAVMTAVWCVAVGIEGNVWVGGEFTDLAGDADADYAAYWDGTNWNAVAAGCNDKVYAIAVAPDGTKYFGGEFTGWDGGSGDGDRIVSYTISGGLVEMETGAQNNQVRAIAINDTGLVYVGGTFTVAGGSPFDYAMAWDGNTFIQLGAGPGGDVYALDVAPDGYLYAAGALADLFEARKWNGYTWADIPLQFPAATTVYALLTMDQDPVVPANYDVWWGFNTNGTLYSAGVATVTNSGSATAFPVIVVNRAGGTEQTLRSIRNETTGDEILMELAMLDGETITLDLRTGVKTLTSDWRGNLAGEILPNSNFATFSLLPGDNLISMYWTLTGAVTSVSFIRWKEQYHSVSGAA
jgi:hypothetical protein